MVGNALCFDIPKILFLSYQGTCWVHTNTLSASIPVKICIYLYNACRTALTAGARVETVGGNIPLEIVPVEYIPEVINNRGKSAYRNFTRRKSARRDFVVQEFCLWNFACRNSTGRKFARRNFADWNFTLWNFTQRKYYLLAGPMGRVNLELG